MSKKFLSISIILITTILLLNVSYATEILMDLNNTVNNVSTPDNTTQTTDNTIYSSEVDFSDNENTILDSEDISTTITTDYDETSDLSISNIINIVLIAVGVVLILLGIAIIIKLK